MNAPTRTITIVCRSHNDYDVFDGERYANRLCWDEMIGQIVSLTYGAGFGAPPRYWCGTAEEHQARRERMRVIAEQQETEAAYTADGAAA